ncbi:ribosome-associated protein L7Ae-like [Insulibacter thermoxylanivorax]|uniref:RNA-binding protein PRECH8_21530 n=1 Tax=Insulibacter thermoxylanivorax TaxID=2749268 RepID=A0A916VG00_9BACL|nr:50S ribosomal protein L7ae-like protein [Insulibacter thermoxylanivorax]GFR38857.1 ribosome-associated protein L7Ae-like [Insulibacter thermoxylanivorax]
MSYEKVSQARKLCVGTKQTLKMVELGKAEHVFVAEDADPRITSKVIQLCEKKDVPIIYVDSMRKLGKACGIDVGAAMAASLIE